MTARHTGPTRRRAPLVAVAGLTGRLVRRGAVIVGVAVAAYAAMEVQIFDTTYPDLASRLQLVMLAQDPAVRVMQGLPVGTSTGALVVWDAGWFMQLILGVWAVVTASRVLRGDEELGRTDLVLAGPVQARAALATQLAVLWAACAGIGLVIGLGMALSGTGLAGALVFAAQVAGFGATFVAFTAVSAQVFGSRGRVVGVASSMLFLAVVVRMVANSADSRTWVAWLTPLGWSDHLQAYGDHHLAVLLVPAAVVLGLGGLAVALRGRRDTGSALVVGHRDARSRRIGTSSALAFAFRSSLGSVLAWGAGVVVLGVATGVLLPSMVEFVEGDASYGEILAAFGLDPADILLGYVAMMATITGLVVALHVTWRIGAARAEEDSQRLEHLLVRPVQRWRWLGGQVLVGVVSGVGLLVASAAATWAAARAAGADLAASDVVAAALNPLPVVAVSLGLAVALLGLSPRLVVPLGAGLTVAAYVLQIVGPALDWPDAVVSLSPFHHLALVPVDPVDTTSALVMLAVAAALTAAGVVAFQRRDLVGG
ncbi:MAG: hypothetical protein HGA44_03955 [Cellulomonadaceae bacterium]|nr:hypothetical protein [Cellulomonadaceae bacterium]